jgi:hypothetical protein
MYKNSIVEVKFLYISGFQKKKGTTPIFKKRPKINGSQIFRYCSENRWYQEKVKKKKYIFKFNHSTKLANLNKVSIPYTNSTAPIKETQN